MTGLKHVYQLRATVRSCRLQGHADVQCARTHQHACTHACSRLSATRDGVSGWCILLYNIQYRTFAHIGSKNITVWRRAIKTTPLDRMSVWIYIIAKIRSVFMSRSIGITLRHKIQNRGYTMSFTCAKLQYDERPAVSSPDTLLRVTLFTVPFWQ